MRIPPSLSEVYPTEICERIALLPDPGGDPKNVTDQQKQIIAIIKDPDVCKAARHVLKKTRENFKNTEDATAWLENFWAFIEDAAGLLGVRPLHARSFVPGKEANFATPAEIAAELRCLKTRCDSLAAALKLRRDVILSDKTDPLIAALEGFSMSQQLDDPNNDAFPQQGRTAGANNWKNDTIHGLYMRAEVRLGERFPTFCHAIHRVLHDTDDIPDPRTAREKSPPLSSRLADPI